MEIGQFVERAVNFQIVHYFGSNNLFHSNHHGGLANHSTTSALVQSSAYDLMDHELLLEKLGQFGFHADTIQWFRSYLTGRSQSVQVEAQQSPSEELGDFAAPQGDNGESMLFVDDDSDIVIL